MSLRISALETASSVQSENDTKNSKISHQFDPKGSSSIEYEARDSSLMQFSPYFAKERDKKCFVRLLWLVI